MQDQLGGWPIILETGKNKKGLWQWVLNALNGYSIEFHTTIFQAHRPHSWKFSQEHQLFVDQVVKKLQDKGAVVQLKSIHQGSKAPPCSRWSETSHKPKKSEHICNTSKWKAFKPSRTSWIEDDWMLKVVLKDAYFSIPINQDHMKYLCASPWGRQHISSYASRSA